MGKSTEIEGVDYGPLAALVGTWEGDKGLDIAPESDGTEENSFFETILFEAIGDVTNGESQNLMVVRYHQIVSRKSNNQVFHNESGYWSWDEEEGIYMQSLTIPRGVALLAGGKDGESTVSRENTRLEVRAEFGDKDWGIVQSPFMRDNAKTIEFHHRITVSADHLEYDETTVLEIYDKTFYHKDSNELKRIK